MESKIRIMIVEDERIVAEDIQRSLETIGYEVCAVTSSGSEALKKVKRDTPDLILMDIVLVGKITGIEAAEQIRSRYDLPVVYLTAYADKNTLEQAKLTEPYGYILKPFEDTELQSTIETALYKHQMERRLREREAWFSTTLRSIGDGIIATDKNGNVMFMNTIAESLTGWNQIDVVGKPIEEVYNIIQNPTNNELGRHVGSASRDENLSDFSPQKILIAKNGRRIPIDDSADPIRDKRGNMIGIVRVFKDITRRKEIEHGIQKRNIQLDTLNVIAREISGTLDLKIIMESALKKVVDLVEFSAGSMFLFDDDQNVSDLSVPCGVGDKMMDLLDRLHVDKTSWYRKNLMEGKINNYSLDEMWDFYHQDLSIPEDVREMLFCLVVPIMEGAHVVGSLNLFGKEKYLLTDLDSDFFRNTGNQIGLAVRNARLFEETNHALEKLKIAQNKLVESEKLASLGAMASNVVHEIGNPLGAITNSIHVLQQRVHLEGRMKELLDIIGWETERLNRSVDQLREFSRPRMFKFERYDLREVVKKSIFILNQDFELTWGKKIVTRFAREVPDALFDSDAMEQVALNLIKNGLQAVKEGGLVEVKVKKAGRDRERKIILEVKDNGKGMSNEDSKRIFEPYFSTKSRGMGLGMHIVKQIIDSHQGSIRVQSKEDFGSTITVEIPVERKNNGANTDRR